MKKGETMAALAFIAFTQHLAAVLLAQAATKHLNMNKNYVQ